MFMVYANFLLDICVANEYLIISIYVFRLILNLIDVMMTVVSRYSTNEISACFIYHVRYGHEVVFYGKPLDTFYVFHGKFILKSTPRNFQIYFESPRPTFAPSTSGRVIIASKRRMERR